VRGNLLFLFFFFSMTDTMYPQSNTRPRGPQKVAIYNAEFVPLAGKAHPRLMGSPFSVGFPEIWDLIKPVFDGAEREGVSHDVKEMLMFVERMGFVEETYFTGNFTPVRGDSGMVAGFYNAVHEITRLKIGERRREMLEQMQIPALSDKVGVGAEEILVNFAPSCHV
jgi:hypothetical protein